MKVIIDGRNIIIEEVDARYEDDVCIVSAFWEDTGEEVSEATYTELHRQVDLHQLWLDQKTSEADFFNEYDQGM